METIVSKPWWARRNFPSFAEHCNLNPMWLENVLLEDALTGGPPVRSRRFYGNLTVEPVEFMARMVKLGFRAIRTTALSDITAGSHILVHEDALLTCNLTAKGKSGDTYFTTANVKLFGELCAYFKTLFVADDPKLGPVYALAKTSDGYAISRVGVAGVPLVRENYHPDAIESYNHIIRDLKSPSPSGRLVIFSGEPGTGKTYFVRSMLTEVPKATFLLVPPQLMKDLGEPAILPTLAEAKEHLDGPIVLLAEDGDKCLVERDMGGDMATIQSVLNLGDGILGSLLDVRIVITTNAETFKMDRAALRPGRLSRHLHVGPLDAEHAEAVVRRLVGPSAVGGFTGPTTLAMAYGKARELGWVAPTTVVTAADDDGGGGDGSGPDSE